jgi:hypothetical protein
MIKPGVPPDEAVQRDLDIDAMVDLDRLLEEVNLDQQRARDALTEYRFAELMADRFRDEHLFLTPYHPNHALARLWAMEVFQRIGLRRRRLRSSTSIWAKVASDIQEEAGRTDETVATQHFAAVATECLRFSQGPKVGRRLPLMFLA